MEEKMPLWKKVPGILWNPSETFGYILRKPDFLASAGMLLALCLIATLPLLNGIAVSTAHLLQQMGVKDPALIDRQMKIVKIITPVGSVLSPVFIWLVTSALARLFNSFTGEKTSFRALFAISVFAYIPVVLGAIVKVPLLLSIPAQKWIHVTLSPAAFLNSTGKLFVFLCKFDPFTIWSLTLLALGWSLAMKVPFYKTAVYLGALWLAYVSIAALLYHLPGVS